MEMVADLDEIEPRGLGADGLSDQFGGAEPFGGELVADLHGFLRTLWSSMGTASSGSRMTRRRTNALYPDNSARNGNIPGVMRFLPGAG
ncbi:hypothetical protein GCM10011588_38770 [Nocardia jinanensis]|uniref:Uncharacterized protein n=1 Tax=Nocardia jinanensis TaxID=382504 RepID=A0A917VUT9_9NOCA|nr:hypothetical protein GCM10011588_38770 [Nocardia jinanensis]